MEFTKKRKAEDDGTVQASPPQAASLSPQDIRKLIEPFSKDQLLEIVQAAATQHDDVLNKVRTLADSDVKLRKLFIRGLASATTTETIRNLFAEYGELEEAIVIFDKSTSKSKGFGFVTYRHVDGALLALKEPSKKIDGRMTVTQLASAGLNNSGNNVNSVNSSDVSTRKIYVGNVPYNIPSERLLGFFSSFGEVEEGPLGFDNTTGKSKGFAFFIYKNEEGAKAAIAEPVKFIDGNQVVCKMAVDNGKKAKGGGPGGYHGGDNVQPSPLQSQQPAVQQPPPSQYGVPGNMPHYTGYNTNAYGMNTSVPIGGGGGGYGGSSGPYGGGYGGGPGAGEFGGNTGNSMYRMNPGPGGMAPASYSDGGAYGMSQPPQPSSLPPRVPPGGMYQSGPPFY